MQESNRSPTRSFRRKKQNRGGARGRKRHKGKYSEPVRKSGPKFWELASSRDRGRGWGRARDRVWSGLVKGKEGGEGEGKRSNRKNSGLRNSKDCAAMVKYSKDAWGAQKNVDKNNSPELIRLASGEDGKGGGKLGGGAEEKRKEKTLHGGMGCLLSSGGWVTSSIRKEARYFENVRKTMGGGKQTAGKNAWGPGIYRVDIRLQQKTGREMLTTALQEKKRRRPWEKVLSTWGYHRRK